jgi:NADPH-dependent curcumin reductase CurA
MDSTINRQWRLARRPVGMVTTTDFRYEEQPVPRAGDGEALVRTLLVSFDPAMRAFLHDRPSYVPPQPIGEVMRAGAVGQVVESRTPALKPGDFVLGAFGWQDYAVTGAAPPAGALKIAPRGPLTDYLSVLGGTGLTAYFGLLDVGRIAAGETVVVSGAAGATGSSAVQIAKLKGCRTIGIAGGPAKCRWLTEHLGADAAIDYKAEPVAARLTELCPGGIDVYFDNVGGPILEAAIGGMALRGRIVLCGMISSYNAVEPPAGPANLFDLITRRVRMEGFLAGDYAGRFDAARQELESWMAAGQLRAFVDVQEGFENIPSTFLRIFTGANLGKQVLKIADPVSPNAG